MTEPNGRWQEEQDRRLAILEAKVDGLPQKVDALKESFEEFRTDVSDLRRAIIVAAVTVTFGFIGVAATLVLTTLNG